MTCDISPEFSQDLLAWYRVNKRSMPWRDRQDDSYAVWISEIMLQQTTVNAVVGFYNRWMERFPTLRSLAEAPLDDVLKHWAGLGYYARARNLHAAGQVVVERFGGDLPRTVSELRMLPGIGPYTAGAIASICFGVDAPVVDANVIRVLCRVCALEGDPKTSTALQKELWAIAEELLPRGGARDFNQGLMELGALVCSPTSPSCTICPVSSFCRAFESGDPTRYPQFADVKSLLDVVHSACLVTFDGRILIVQRPFKELWGGLWEVPRVATTPGEELDAAAVRAVLETVGLTVTGLQTVGVVKHVVTNRRVSLHGYRTEWNGVGQPNAVGCRQFAWVTPGQLDSYAISTPQQELLSLWIQGNRQQVFGI